MTRSNLLNALGFNAGWLACVVGGNAWALLAAALLLPLHFHWASRDRREWLLATAFALVGLCMDLGWQAAGLLQFTGAGPAGIPPWLAVLWLLFSVTLFHSLAWLQQRLLLAAMLGALSGPLSYIAGIRLGAASSQLSSLEIALWMAPAWALLLPALLWVARGRNPAGRLAHA